MNLEGINVTLPIQLLFKIMEKANETNIIRKQMSYIRKSLLPMQMMRIWSDSRNFTNRQ